MAKTYKTRHKDQRIKKQEPHAHKERRLSRQQLDELLDVEADDLIEYELPSHQKPSDGRRKRRSG